jgi:hypothetical protein
MKLLLVILLAASAQAATLVRLACGASTVQVDSQGNLWAPDSSMTPGGSVWTAAIAEPVPYNHLRYSNPAAAPMTYTFQVPAGSYSVTLKFTEPSRGIAGSRVFGVTINGTAVLSSLDLFAQAGKLQPYDFTANATAGNGTLSIVLQSSVSNSVISGIQIDDAPTGALSPSLNILEGTEAGLPSICPASVWINFYVATDTGHLWWCSVWLPSGATNGGPWTRILNDVAAKPVP